MKRLSFLIITLICAAAVAQDLPRIAVYVTGNVGDDEKKALGTRMLASLVNSGRYTGIERSNSFLAEIEKEQEKQRSGAIDDNQISALGKQFGVKYVCIADITPVLGAFQISARIVDVETAEVAFIGESYSALKNVIDLVSVCDQVVRNMFGGQAALTPRPISGAPPKPKPEPAPEPEPPRVDSVNQAKTEPPEPEPPPAAAVQPQPEQAAPEPKQEYKQDEKQENPRRKPKNRYSFGAGGFFANDVGGGLKWDNGEQLAMPYSGCGAYMYFDLIYAEIFAGYSAGGGKWKSGDAKYKDYLPDMRRAYVNGGAFLKLPFGFESVKFFPLLGVDYELSVLGKLEYGEESVVEAISSAGGALYRRPDDGALSALWVKFGGGLDIGLGKTAYLRAELLYGLRTANAYEIKYAGILITDRNGRYVEGESRLGGGLTAKTGVGIKF